MTDIETNNISPSSLSAIDEDGLNIPEFTESDDLLDTFLLRYPVTNTEPEVGPYSPKEIVSTYSKRIKTNSAEEGTCSGVLQVNQFWKLLNSWYQTRFTPTTRNPNFHFKANRIHEWIDLLMIAAGRALHEGLFSRFIEDVNAWIQQLNTASDDTWVLPYCVMQVQNFDPTYCTPEAVLLECMVKPFLYDNSFYPNEKHSVKKIVIEHGGYLEQDLTLENIVATCSTILRTSSFDASKYQEV